MKTGTKCKEKSNLYFQTNKGETVRKSFESGVSKQKGFNRRQQVPIIETQIPDSCKHIKNCFVVNLVLSAIKPHNKWDQDARS